MALPIIILIFSFDLLSRKYPNGKQISGMDQDVAAYYNQTQNHYRRWWKLDSGMALHYGMWYAETRTFLEALNNTNCYLADLADIREGKNVLDAGCGVGGSAIFIAKKYKARVTGISLSELQIKTASQNAKNHKVEELVDFHVKDYCNTGFIDASFDLIWACESSSSASDKVKMVKEWYRLLKPGGKLVLSDFLKSDKNQDDPDELLKNWSELWAMGPLVSETYLAQCLTTAGFQINNSNDLTQYIKKTVKRMYISYLCGSLPARIYNFTFGARKYARNHYKSGFYQFKALKKGLWQYQVLVAEKPTI